MKRLRWTGIYLLSLSVVIVVRIGLWTTKYQKIRARMVRPCSADPQRDRIETVARIVHAVEATARFIPDASCLTQSISVQALLSWKGIPSTISMGVMKDEGGVLRAHAWLSWDGRVVLEGNEETVKDFSKVLDLPTPVATPLS
jgi:hypothetical protein